MEHLFRDGIFAGDVAIVTGGGTGIGLEVCRELGTLNAKIAIYNQQPKPLKINKTSLEKNNIKVLAQTYNIRKPKKIMH